MGDVVQLPVRREPPQQDTGRPERPDQTRHQEAAPAAEPRPVEPLWRESVGRQLREQRVADGKRLVDVAEEAGVSPQYLSEVERGLKDPSSELLAAIAGALGLSVAEIATRVASTTLRPPPRPSSYPSRRPSAPSPQSPVCLAA